MLQMCTKTAVEREHFERRLHARNFRVLVSGGAEVGVQHWLLGKIKLIHTFIEEMHKID